MPKISDKTRLKRQIQQLIDSGAIEGFYSDGTTEMTLALKGGVDMDVSIIEDEDGYNFLAIAVHNPVDN